MATEVQTLDMVNRILKLLNEFFDTNMTKEELRLKYQNLLKGWKL